MMRVGFLLCGVQKAGTSAMDQYLRQHPQLCLADRKEVHYFDDDKHSAHESSDHEWYHRWFAPTEQHTLIGECTPAYLYWDDAMKRIQEYNPEMKLIVILRNPIERAYSHWAMETGRGQEDRPFIEAINGESERLGSETHQCLVRSYLDRGFYSKQLTRMWSLFPKEQTLILRYESLSARPQALLEEVFEFLEVDQAVQIQPALVHRTEYPRSMSKAERDLLIEIFVDEIQRLEQLLGWDCRDWFNQSSVGAP